MFPPVPRGGRRAVLAGLTVLGALPLACEKPKEAGERPAPEAVVAPVATRDVEIRSEWVGTTTGFVNAQVFPKIEGYLLRQAYRDGSVVKPGQLLFEIDPRQYRAALDDAKGQVARTQAVLERARIDVARYTPLVAQGAVSQKELDDATQALAASKAQLDSDKAALEQARLNLDWTKVLSPIAGIAGIAKAQVGDLVGPTTLLTDVSQLDPIKVNFQPSEIDYLRFAKRVNEVEASGEPGHTALTLTLANGDTYPHAGRIAVAGLGVSATTGTFQLQGEFPNPDNLLRPGQFVRVSAVTDQFDRAVVIPQRAVRDLQGVKQVAVVGPDDKVTFRNVTLGPVTGSDYVVTEGLQAGEKIVLEGLQKIRDGVAVKPVAPKGDTPASAVAAPAGEAKPAPAPSGANAN